MDIQLKKHNEETFEKVYELFKVKNKVAVEQATGTGKSYITAKAISCFSKKRALYITSGTQIIKEFKESQDLNTLVDMTKIDFMTYQKALTFDVENTKNKYDFIVLDEYHRAGAKRWSLAIKNILNAFPNIKVLGTTATPVRYLDNKRNMSEEIFDGNIANQITLSDAINKNILTKPKYILGMYDYNINKRLERVAKKKEILEKTKYLTNNLDSLYGIPNILRKHITYERKFIIFCESTEHLNEMKPIVFRWFKEVFTEDVSLYSIHSNKSNNKEDYENFKASTTGFNLLLAVNMLNEGVHIDVDGLIFLRSTSSAIIYHQQLGRALTASHKKAPIVFDFVKNSNKILTMEYKDKKKTGVNKMFMERDLDYSIEGYFDVYDETLDFQNTIREIELHISGWMDKYEELAKFWAVHNHLNIPTNESVLYRFLLLQKRKYYMGELEEEKIKLLEKLGIQWDYHENNKSAKWRNRLNEISDYIKIHGNLDVPRSEESLYKFLSNQKNLYLKGKLTDSKIEDLINAGFDLNLINPEKSPTKIDADKPKRKTIEDINNIWEIRFEELIEFKKEFGHCNVPRNYINKKLAEWVHTQRSKKTNLSKDRKDRLVSLGFEFNVAKKNNEEQWNKMFNKLIDFKKEYGHCRVSSRYKDSKLFNWTKTQKVAFNAGKLSNERYNKLIEIGFIF